MLFKKRKKPEPAPAFPGRTDALDGYGAVLAVERLSGAIGAAYPDVDTAFPAPEGSAPRTAASAGALGGLAAGLSAAGVRAAAFTRGDALDAMRASLSASAARHLPFVVHHAGPAGAGAFRLYARTVQEAADFALVARRVAEHALLPGVCAQDAALTAASVQPVLLPEPTLVDAYLGRADDEIDTPTPAQAFLFGPRRRRLPAPFDLDRPLGLGVAFDDATAYRAGAADDAFFASHLPALVDEAFGAFAGLTGRRYARAAGYRLDDAEYVVVAYGAVAADLEAVADHLRRHAKIRAGVLHLAVLHPFPGDLVSHLLHGKKGVTVLEHGGDAASAGAPVLQEVRAALDRAAENGAVLPADALHRGYARYAGAAERPVLFSARYGPARPAFAGFCGVFENMTPAGPRRPLVHLDLVLGRTDARLPGLERLQQQLRKGYPNLDQLEVPREHRALQPPHAAHPSAFQLCTTAGWEGPEAGRLLARALFHGLGQQVRTVPAFDAHAPFQAARYTVLHAAPDAAGALPALPPDDRVDGLVLSSAALLDDAATLAAAADDAVVVLHAAASPEAVWDGLSRRTRHAIRDRRLRLFVVDAARVAEKTASDPVYAPFLAMQALVGAFVKHYAPEEGAVLLEGYHAALVPRFPAVADDLERTLERGAAACVPVPWKTFAFEAPPTPEPDAPWTVAARPGGEGTLHDPVRFWDDVGFLHATGRADQALVDPFLAARAMPAATSPFRRLAAHHAPSETGAPRLSTERCTACAACAAVCPDAALAVTVQDVGTLVEQAMAACEAGGEAMLQLRRALPHLVRQAHRAVAADDLRRYATLGAVLTDAFAWLVEKMNPNADQRAELDAEFGRLHEHVAALPLVRSEAFFTAPERAEKGSGLVFTFAVDPDACKACGLCAAACPDDALAMAPRPDADAGRRTRDFVRALPDVPVARLTPRFDAEKPETYTLAFLNRRVRHARLGGEHAAPGDGPRLALRLVAGAAEAALQPHVDALVAKMADLAARLEDRVRRRLSDAYRVNDFDAFAHQLAAVGGSPLDRAALARLLDAEAEHAIDKAALQRLADGHAALVKLHARYTGAGDGRARAGMVIGTTQEAHRPPAYPYNPYPFPWIFHLPGDAGAVAEGLYEGMARQMADAFRTIRRAELLANDTYVPAEHDAFLEGFDRHAFTPEERAACPPLVLVLDDASAPLDALLGGTLPLKVVLLGAPALPGAAASEPALAALVHGRAFVLQAAAGDPGRLLKGVLRGLAHDGPALFHLYAPDPLHHGLRPERVVDHARRAVVARAFPAFTFDPALPGDLRHRLDLAGNLAGNPGATPLNFADWAVQEARFHAHFRFVPRPDWHPGQVPLADYLALPAGQREGKEPFVEVAGADGRPVRKVVSAAMVAATEAKHATWRLLQELAGVRSTLAEEAAARAAAELARLRADLEARLRAAYDEQAAALEATHAQHYHDLLTRQLLTLSGFGEGAAAAETLRAFLRTASKDASKDASTDAARTAEALPC